MATLGANDAQNSAVARQGSNHEDRLSIWLADLESIRREQPVVSPNLFMAQRVLSQSTQAEDPVAKGAGKAGSEVIVVDYDDDDGDDDRHGLHTFYGQQGTQPGRADEMIRYQDHSLARQNKYPSRQNGFGFDMDRLRRDKAWADPIRTLQDVQPAWDHAMFMRQPPLGFDEAVARNWAQDSLTASLLFGFPMLGNVVFYRPGNYGGARSACFFKALAYLVYGDQSLNQRVQAEHLQHFGDVLEWDDHPRHQLYTEMNQRFFNTTISTDSDSSARNTEVDTAANFFQLLSIPQAWIPLDMLDVTADLYNLFIVVFTINESTARLNPLVTEVNVKGSYNARHVFLLFNGFHYQPMVPNEFLASEFTFPRVTYENVKRLPWSRDTDQGKSSPDLRWRMTWGPRLDRRMGALPVDHVFYKESLRTAMTGTYSQQ